MGAGRGESLGVVRESTGSGPDSVYGAVGISLVPTTIHGTQGVPRNRPSFHGPGRSPLLGALEAVDLGKHICNLILQFLWTHIQGSAWRPHSAQGSGVLPQPSRPHPLSGLFYLQSGSSVPLCGSCACTSPRLGGGSPSVHTRL